MTDYRVQIDAVDRLSPVMHKLHKRFEFASASMGLLVRSNEALLELATEQFIEDPMAWHAATLRQWLAKAKAIMQHEFWMAAGKPHLSPGAVWNRP